MSLQYFLLVLIAATCLAQGLEVTIRTDASVYQRRDSIYITIVFKNVSGNVIKFLAKGA